MIPIAFAFSLVLVPASPPGGVLPRTRRFELSYAAEVHSGTTAGPLRAWLPLPRESAEQRVERLRTHASVPHRLTTDPVYGNRMLHVERNGASSASGAVTFGYSCIVTRREVRSGAPGAAAPAPTALDSRLLADDRMAVVKHPLVAATLARVRERAGTDAALPRAIYDYVTAEMVYEKSVPGWGEGDTLRACRLGMGNCTDFHSLFTSLCRSAGVAAQFAIGFPLPRKRGEGEVPGYHCWAYFLSSSAGWVPVDASEAASNPALAEYYFGGLTEDRVELTRGRDLVLVPSQSGAPLNYFVFPYTEVDGRPGGLVQRRVTYRDLEESPGPGPGPAVQ